jgi:hypothetical protein
VAAVTAKKKKGWTPKADTELRALIQKRTKRKSPRGPIAKPRRRYGIGEWYGTLLVNLDPKDRIALAESQFKPKKERPITPCPFRSTPVKTVACTKEGGVCTTKLYQADSLGPGRQRSRRSRDASDDVPHRFEEKGLIYTWIGQIPLNHESPLVVSEVGFLELTSPEFHAHAN